MIKSILFIGCCGLAGYALGHPGNQWTGLIGVIGIIFLHPFVKLD